jgi:hypothetical protein
MTVAVGVPKGGSLRGVRVLGVGSLGACWCILMPRPSCPSPIILSQASHPAENDASPPWPLGQSPGSFVERADPNMPLTQPPPPPWPLGTTTGFFVVTFRTAHASSCSPGSASQQQRRAPVRGPGGGGRRRGRPPPPRRRNPPGRSDSSRQSISTIPGGWAPWGGCEVVL